MIATAKTAGRHEPDHGLVTYTQLIYALHACAVLTGIFTTSSIAGRFLFGFPSVLAIILNYARRAEARGTWLESHFEWQMHTFWYALLWIGVSLLIGAPLTLIVIGVYVVAAGFSLVGLWVAYRVARGWLSLRERRSMAPTLTPAPAATT